MKSSGRIGPGASTILMILVVLVMTLVFGCKKQTKF